VCSCTGRSCGPRFSLDSELTRIPLRVARVLLGMSLFILPAPMSSVPSGLAFSNGHASDPRLACHSRLSHRRARFAGHVERDRSRGRTRERRGALRRNTKRPVLPDECDRTRVPVQDRSASGLTRRSAPTDRKPAIARESAR